MNRKTFFKSIAALGVAVGIAPKVLAEKESDNHVFNQKILLKRLDDIKKYPKTLDVCFFRVRSVTKEYNHRYSLEVSGYSDLPIATLVVDEFGSAFYVVAAWRNDIYSTIKVMPLSSDQTEPPIPGMFGIKHQYYKEA